MGKDKDRHIHAGIGPQDHVAETLNDLGLTPDAVRIHMSDRDGELITDGDEPVARVAWIRRGLSPRKELKQTKKEKKNRKELKKKLRRRSRFLEKEA